MRRFIRRWLGIEQDNDTSKGRDVHIPHEHGPTMFVNRISNGFLVQLNGRCTYCQTSEEIAGVVVAAYTNAAIGTQLELFSNQAIALGASAPSRPFNQPHV